ncbi:MAG: hypothetical protein WBO10_17955 [Pyrinomonadaceae bacterium]
MEEYVAEPAIPRLSRDKRMFLFVYFPSFLFTAFCLAVSLPQSTLRTLDIITAVGINFAQFAWVRIDSRERGYELHRAFPFLIVIFGTFAFLYYIFRSRGFVQGIVATGWLLAYFFGVVLSLFIIVLVVVVGLALTGILPPTFFDGR